MTFKELLDWQWDGYNHFHLSQVNLLIHIVAVPLFIVSALGVFISLLQASWIAAVANFSVAVLAMRHKVLGTPKRLIPLLLFQVLGKPLLEYCRNNLLPSPNLY